MSETKKSAVPLADVARDCEALMVTASRPDERRREAVGPVREVNGPKGPEPTRFGDWERNGRCIDF